MTNATKGRILKWTAIGIDTAVPFVATVSQFPVWIEKSAGATVSGLFLCLAFLCALPFAKQIIAYIKSPSVPVGWAVLFVLFICLRNIIDQMLVVLLVGMIANIAGSFLYHIGKNIEGK